MKKMAFKDSVSGRARSNIKLPVAAEVIMSFWRDI